MGNYAHIDTESHANAQYMLIIYSQYTPMPFHFLSSRPIILIIVVTFVTQIRRVSGMLSAVVGASLAPALTLTSCIHPSFVLEIGPSLHRDLAAVKFALNIAVAATLASFPIGFSCVTP